MHFFALRMTIGLKIPGAVIPRRVFTQPGSKPEVTALRQQWLVHLDEPTLDAADRPVTFRTSYSVTQNACEGQQQGNRKCRKEKDDAEQDHSSAGARYGPRRRCTGCQHCLCAVRLGAMLLGGNESEFRSLFNPSEVLE